MKNHAIVGDTPSQRIKKAADRLKRAHMEIEYLYGDYIFPNGFDPRKHSDLEIVQDQYIVELLAAIKKLTELEPKVEKMQYFCLINCYCNSTSFIRLSCNNCTCFLKAEEAPATYKGV